MTLVSSLMSWLAGRPVPPAVPLCLESCGRLADTSDGSPRCVPCGLRLAHLAMRPDVFTEDEIVAAARAHADVVSVGSEAIERHMHLAWNGLVIHETHRLAWIWSGAWPTDDRTLDDVRETRSLERLWGTA
ncbi:MAG: hypothetical protein V4515_12250 [Chloroflexota bacterium]